MFGDRQIDSVRSRLIRADLKRLVKGEKIEATVPLRLIGEPIGVREQAGVLEQIIRNVENRCEPREIPQAVEGDVTKLGVPHGLHLSDNPISEGIKIPAEPDVVISNGW